MKARMQLIVVVTVLALVCASGAVVAADTSSDVATTDESTDSTTLIEHTEKAQVHADETYETDHSEDNVDAVDEPKGTHVTINEQESSDESIVIDEVSMASGGFIVVHNTADDPSTDSVIGTSEYLERGTYENIEVSIDESPEDDESVTVVLHRDSTNSNEFEFIESAGAVDVPYEVNGELISDQRSVEEHEEDETEENDEEKDEHEDDEYEKDELKDKYSDGKVTFIYVEEINFDNITFENNTVNIIVTDPEEFEEIIEAPMPVEPDEAFFEVSDLDPMDVTVTQGDLIDVSATVTNTGDEEATQTVEFRVDDQVLDEQEVTLDAGEDEMVTFEGIDTAALEPGEYTHGIFTDDAEQTATLTVEAEEPEEAFFEVSDLDPMEATVTQGDVIDVSATVTNTEEAEGTQTVELRVDDDVIDEQEVTLEGTDSETVTFEDVDTAALEPGEYTHGVFSDDDSETGTLTVEEEEPEEAFLEVSDLDPVEATVTQGDTFDVSATVTNTGEAEGTQTVELRVDDDVIDEQEVTVDANEDEMVTFVDVDTAELEPGEYTHGVFTDDDSETGTLTVEEEEPEEAFFEVSDLDPIEATVTQGDVIDVSATVENTEEAEGTQTVELRINDDVIDEQEVTLEGTDSETVTFEDVDTAALEPGEYTHGVFSDDDSETGTLTVEAEEEPEEAFFEVTNLDPMDVTVTQGDLIDVSATVTNTGDEEATQTVEFRVDDQVLDEQEVTLEPDAEETVTFEEIDTTDLEPDEYTHGVFSDDDSETATLTVEAEEPEEAFFEVSDLDPVEATVTQGDTFDVSATVTNTEAAEGTQTVELRVDDDVIDEQEVTLDAGEDEMVTFVDVDTAELEPTNYTHGIFTDDDSETGTLTVEEEEPEEAFFEVSDLDPMEATVTQGDVIDVSATVTNTEEAEGTQTVELRVDDDVIDEQEVTLEGTDSETVTFENVDTAALEPGEYTHGVFSDDDSETGTLTVEAEEEPEVVSFDVLSLDAPASAETGETITVSAEVTNPGDEESTQDVQFRLEGILIDAQEVTLDAGETETVDFEVDTDGLPADEYVHMVLTDEFGIVAFLELTEAVDEDDAVDDDDEAIDDDDDAVDDEDDVVDDDDDVVDDDDDAVDDDDDAVDDDDDAVDDEDNAVDEDDNAVDDEDNAVDDDEDNAVDDEDNAVDDDEDNAVDDEDNAVDDDEEDVVDDEDNADDSNGEELEGESFDVLSLDAPASAEAGETITVSAEVTNPGDEESTQDVQFRIEGILIDAQEVTLDAGETETVDFEVDTDGLPADEYVHMVLTDEFGMVAFLELTEAVDDEDDAVDDEDDAVDDEDDAVDDEDDAVDDEDDVVDDDDDVVDDDDDAVDDDDDAVDDEDDEDADSIAVVIP